MTGQIPPRSAPTIPPEDRSCDNCRYVDRTALQEPCNTCAEGGVGSYGQWEPSKPEWMPVNAPNVGKVKPITAPDILSAAEKHMRDRAATYDKPEGERSMAQTVAVFNAFHGTTLTEAHGWHFMQILKDVRLFTRAGYHADSAEDGVAYAGLKAEAKAKE